MAMIHELAALERKWARRQRRYEALCAIAWALFALIVFACTALETGKVAGKLSTADLGPAAMGSGVAVQASHKAGPSIVADQLHSKMEGKCR